MGVLTVLCVCVSATVLVSGLPPQQVPDLAESSAKPDELVEDQPTPTNPDRPARPEPVDTPRPRPMPRTPGQEAWATRLSNGRRYACNVQFPLEKHGCRGHGPDQCRNHWDYWDSHQCETGHEPVDLRGLNQYLLRRSKAVRHATKGGRDLHDFSSRVYETPRTNEPLGPQRQQQRAARRLNLATAAASQPAGGAGTSQRSGPVGQAAKRTAIGLPAGADVIEDPGHWNNTGARPKDNSKVARVSEAEQLGEKINSIVLAWN